MFQIVSVMCVAHNAPTPLIHLKLFVAESEKSNLVREDQCSSVTEFLR